MHDDLIRKSTEQPKTDRESTMHGTGKVKSTDTTFIAKLKNESMKDSHDDLDSTLYVV